MNLLFVNYGDFTSNSLNHIGAFANQLTLLGHACVVAVPDNPESISVVHEPLFTPVTFTRALQSEPLFPDRRPAAVVHVWTPRENVREFTLNFLSRNPAATLIIHLEDNEAFLIESYAHEPLAKLRALSDEELAARLSPRLSHPVRFRNFLRLAHGVTFITDRLREFIPEGTPAHRLLPGIDPAIYRPSVPDPALRAELGLQPDEKVLVFTGSTTFANLADVRTLLLAVRRINERGVPCKLVRTGINPPELAAELAALSGGHVIDLGFIAKARLGALLSLADALVQPGTADAFNDYRLPSKIPEFLSVGRPVILPRANLATEMENGRHALFLTSGTPDEIADKCLRVFNDPEFARSLSVGALEFARAHFDLKANTADLLRFYESTRATATPLAIDASIPASEDVLLAEGDLALRMRAKEQTIAFTRSLVTTRDAELAAVRTHVGNQENTIQVLQSAVTDLQKGLKDQHRAIGEFQGTIEQLNTAHRELQSQREAACAERDAIAGSVTELQGSLARQHEESSRTVSELQGAIEQLNAAQRELESRHQAALAERDAIAASAEQARAQYQTEKTRMLAGFKRVRDDLLADFLRDKAILAAQSDYHHSRLHTARQRIALLETQLNEAHVLVGTHTREMAALKLQLEEAAVSLAQRELKIRRMTASFSWQVTAPFRALRRWLIDPRAPRRAHASAGPRIQLDRSLEHRVDEPAAWSPLPSEGIVRGWIFSPAAAIRAVRLVTPHQTFEGCSGLSRPDVANAHPAQPHARQSGFLIEYSLRSEGPLPLVLEALTADGRWRPFATPLAEVAAPTPAHLCRNYQAWLARFGTLTPGQTATLRTRLEALAPDRRPSISVIMPVYNTPETWLVKAIESVRAQLYPHWELCIADDASPAAHVRPVLDTWRQRDSRLKVVYRTENGHISAASNSALQLATGQFVVLLDHDDELAPTALAELVLALDAQPRLEFIYSDEDKIDECGRRFDPYFKPDWNPDLLLGQNYTCHLSAFRTERLRAIGGFRLGYEGSQDWDLTLRAVEGLDSAAIHHIPRVLYHWRAIPGSTALLGNEKNDYPMIAARKALVDHLARTGHQAELVPVNGHHWRVKRALPAEAPKVSIIIPTRNGERLLRVCIGSLLARTSYPNFEIIIVNNRSDEPATLEYFQEIRAGVRVLDYDAPFNFSAINNFAARHAEGAILAFLNNDLEVISPDWLDEMVAQAVRPDIGAVGAMLYYPNDTVQHAGVVLGLTGPAGKDGVAGHAFKCAPRGAEGQRNRLRLVQNYSAVTAACLVIRRATFEAVGGFNEADLAVAFNDIDFCLRVRRAGFRNLWTPFAEFYHHESASRGLEDTPEKIARFQAEIGYMRRTWGDLLDQDPAYNLNLSLQHEDFSLGFPPRGAAILPSSAVDPVS